MEGPYVEEEEYEGESYEHGFAEKAEGEEEESGGIPV
jgi:hypothetical protein